MCILFKTNEKCQNNYHLDAKIETFSDHVVLIVFKLIRRVEGLLVHTYTRLVVNKCAKRVPILSI